MHNEVGTCTEIIPRLLIIKGKLEDSAFTTVNIYAPNVDRCSCQFFENLQGHLLEFGISDEDNIIIGGDFNCPLIWFHGLMLLVQ